ncbi:MAG: glycosyltransferase family 4 protein [Candidatus Omnitrophica bacterium]|nr:glycosyltransferase family 4 protein [Candidatus Omnitrophota bacterium]
MRVLHITSHLNVGGITTYVVSLAEALARRGHQVVVASGGGALASRCARDGLTHWEAPLATSAEFSPQVWRAARQLDGLLARQTVDVIHAHTRVAQVVAHGLWRRHGIPYVTTWHGFYRRRLSRRWWPCTGTRTIAISRPVADHLQAVFRVPESRIHLIPHGIDAARFAAPAGAAEVQALRARLNLDHAGPIIGTVARLVPSKGVDHLLEAFRRVVSSLDSARDSLRSQTPDASLLIVGDGPQRARLERVASQLGIQRAVRFAGTLPDTRAALALMDCFVFMPATEEGFGLSLLEAMASRRPIVAVRRGGGSTWALEESQAGLLVEPDDPQALADAIVRIMQDGALAGQLAACAQETARTRYDFERVVTQVEQVYQACVGQRHG